MTANRPSAPASLVDLKGLGRTYARHLGDAGIDSIGELARFDSPDDLHTHLLEQGVTSVPLSKIEQEGSDYADWVTQAKRRLHERASFTILVLEDNGHVPTIQVFNNHTDEPPQNFDVDGTTAWANSVLDQADLDLLPVAADTETVVGAPPSRPTQQGDGDRFELADLSVTRIAAESSDRNDRLEIEVSVGLLGPRAEQMRDDAHQLTFIARDEASGALATLGSVEVRFASDGRERIEHSLPIPPVGDYRILCIATGGATDTLIETLVGPRLNVRTRQT